MRELPIKLHEREQVETEQIRKQMKLVLVSCVREE